MLRLNILPTSTKSDQNIPSSSTNDDDPIIYISTTKNEVIRPDQTPSLPTWVLQPMYKMSATGSYLVWQVGFDGIDHLEMKTGMVGGQIRTNRTEVKTNSSGRSMLEQALMEARQRYKLKFREGYQPAGSDNPATKTGMKGNKYEPEKPLKIWPVYTQPKLDGIRMLIHLDGGNLTKRSFRNNVYTHINHFDDELLDFFSYLPSNSTLDGELYNHQMRFNEISSAVRTRNRIHPKLNLIQYWIFDIDYISQEGNPYEKRYELLVNAYHKYIQDNGKAPTYLVIVPSEIAMNHEELTKQHNAHIANHFEGIMIKKISNGYPEDSQHYKSCLYKGGKNNNILKWKYFHDEEGIITGVTDAEGTEKGAAMLIVRDPRGNSFPLRMKGSFDQRRYWLQHPDEILGKEVTYRYQELSEYGVPRFPVGIDIRDYE